MLNGLAAVGIISHVHDLHLADFVYHLPVVAVVEDGRQLENGVEHGVECVAPAHDR